MPEGNLQLKNSQKLQTKKLVWFCLVLCVCNYTQVLWASPSGMSAADLTASPIDYLHWICLLSITFSGILLLIFRAFKLSYILQSLILTLLMSAFWIFINYDEFIMRVASWSTFSTKESWFYAIQISAWPVSICATVLFLSTYQILKSKKHDS